MKRATILILLLAFSLSAADSPTDRANTDQKTVLVRLNYATEVGRGDAILTHILLPLTENGFTVSLDRQILEQEVKWLEGAHLTNTPKQVLETYPAKQVLDYLRAALTQNTLQPTLPSPPLPPLIATQRNAYRVWGYLPWNRIFLGDLSNRVVLAATNITPGARILNFNVRLVVSPNYNVVQGGKVVGEKASGKAPDVTLATFIGQDSIRTVRIEPKFDVSYPNATDNRENQFTFSSVAKSRIQDFLKAKITDDWFKTDVSK